MGDLLLIQDVSHSPDGVLCWAHTLDQRMTARECKQLFWISTWPLGDKFHTLKSINCRPKSFYSETCENINQDKDRAFQRKSWTAETWIPATGFSTIRNGSSGSSNETNHRLDPRCFWTYFRIIALGPNIKASWFLGSVVHPSHWFILNLVQSWLWLDFGCRNIHSSFLSSIFNCILVPFEKHRV